MQRKKKGEETDKICHESLCDGDRFSIPEGATEFEFEVDTSSCYYESDTPSYIITFYKKKT